MHFLVSITEPDIELSGEEEPTGAFEIILIIQLFSKKGDIITIPFPFTDLSGNKKRPAFVIADLPGDDIIVCQDHQ